MKRPDLFLAPSAVFIFGFGASLAANLLWTWSGGPVRVLGGAFASIALPAAIHLWPRVYAPERLVRGLRNLVMATIAVLAATTTFWHASSLLVAHGEEVWLARAYPIMTELLVVFAVLANRTPRKVVTPAARRAPSQVAPKPTPAKTNPGLLAPPTPPSEITAHRGDRDDRVAWLRGQPEMSWTDQVRAVEQQFGVSRSTAKRVVSEVA